MFIFTKIYDYNMYLFGKIVVLPNEEEKGIIKGFNGKEYFYETRHCLYPIPKGKICGFLLFSDAQRKNQPRKIQRAFVSKDRQLIIDRPKSHLHDGITPQLLKKVCSQINCGKAKNIKKQINFKEAIGTTTCVSITENDELIYAVRKDRRGHSKFVLNRTPAPTKSATIVLKKAFNYYQIKTAYLGTASEVEPKDRRATLASIKFWATHALIFGSEPIIKNTMTKVCPWTARKI